MGPVIPVSCCFPHNLVTAPLSLAAGTGALDLAHRLHTQAFPPASTHPFHPAALAGGVSLRFIPEGDRRPPSPPRQCLEATKRTERGSEGGKAISLKKSSSFPSHEREEEGEEGDRARPPFRIMLLCRIFSSSPFFAARLRRGRHCNGLLWPPSRIYSGLSPSLGATAQENFLPPLPPSFVLASSSSSRVPSGRPHSKPLSGTL